MQKNGVAFDGLWGTRPVSEMLRDCLAEAARRGDLLALAWLNYENADNSEPPLRADNERLLKLQLESAGLSGGELESVFARLAALYDDRRAMRTGKRLAIPVSMIEELRQDALERVDALCVRAELASGAEHARLNGSRERLLGFIEDAESALNATRRALIDFVGNNWAANAAITDITPASGAANLSPANPGAAEISPPSAISPASHSVILVCLNSPHCGAAKAMLEKLGERVLLAQSIDELNALAESGLRARTGIILASVDSNEVLAHVGYTLGMLNASIGRGNTCLLANLNDISHHMRAFASEIHLYYFNTPEECERLVALMVRR